MMIGKENVKTHIMLLFVYFVSGDLARQSGCHGISLFQQWLLRKENVYLLALCGRCLSAELVFCGVTENTPGAF